MFNVTGSEILILLVLALVVVGPERLPEVARKFAKSYGELKKMSTGFQTELRDALDEPLREMRSTADQLRKTIEEPINETITSGTNAVKGGIANGAGTSAGLTDSKSAPADSSVDPVLAADGALAAAAAAGDPRAAGASDLAEVASSDRPSASSEVRPSGPFDRAVSSASPRSAVAVEPPPAGAVMLPPPSATANAFLPPPTAAQAADPLTAPGNPSA